MSIRHATFQERRRSKSREPFKKEDGVKVGRKEDVPDARPGQDDAPNRGPRPPGGRGRGCGLVLPTKEGGDG